MYYPHNIEELCYEPDHIEKVINEITIKFNNYFKEFIETESGNIVVDDNIIKLAKSLKAKLTITKKHVNYSLRFNQIIKDSLEDFKKDRKNYLDILDEEFLEEYLDDPGPFKNKVLRNDCPIIRKTLNSSAKELNKYKKDFGISDPSELLDKVINIAIFGHEYNRSIFNSNFYNIKNVNDLKFNHLLTEEYIVYGVIGGGIKSHFLYKMYPQIFPNRSHNALWALWYLTSKKKFDCKEDSEFLMINIKESTTQQNFFYPYDLFTFYAIHILHLLKSKAKEEKLKIPQNYSFVIVDEFLNFITSCHSDEILPLKKQIKNYSYDY